MNDIIRKAIKRVAAAVLPASTYRRLAFSRVYRRGSWGDDDGRFFSGVGSRGEAVAIYVDALATELRDPAIIVDLGCGDFVVGRELTRRFKNAKYIGCDLVPDLIDHHRRVYGNSRTDFRLLDAVTDPIPAGDVYLIRQVFQHLSNDEISTILRKIPPASLLLVTEGHPLVRTEKSNRDKIPGFDTRFDTSSGFGSGVYLDEPPFNRTVRELCRVEMPGSEIIVTWVVT